MSGDGKLTQEQADAIQRANAEWNARALSAEAAKVGPHYRRLPEALTMEDIADERDIARANDWKMAERWPWVDAVAWVAFGGAEIMPLLSAFRSKSGREHDANADAVERECWAVMETRVDRLSVEDAERQLRAWCRGGLAVVDGSGCATPLPDDRRPHEVMLLAADVQRAASSFSVSDSASSSPIVPREEWENEGRRIAALLDSEGMAKRDVRQRHIDERWDRAKGKPIAVAVVTGWMKGQPKSGRPPKSV